MNLQPDVVDLLIFQTKNSARSKSQTFKYEGLHHQAGIRQLEFDASNQFFKNITFPDLKSKSKKGFFYMLVQIKPKNGNAIKYIRIK